MPTLAPSPSGAYTVIINNVATHSQGGVWNMVVGVGISVAVILLCCGISWLWVEFHG